MARPKGVKNRTPAEREAAKQAKQAEKEERARKKAEGKTAPRAPEVGHNSGLNDDEARAALVRHAQRISALEAEKKSIEDDIKEAFEVAKTDGVPRADIRTFIKLQKDESGKALIELQRQHRIAVWLGHPIGTQFTLFEGPDRTPIVDKAFEDGKRAGIAATACSPPHAPGSPAYEPWIKGWHVGQAINASGIKKMETPSDRPTETVEEAFDESLPDAQGEDGEPPATGDAPPTDGGAEAGGFADDLEVPPFMKREPVEA